MTVIRERAADATFTSVRFSLSNLVFGRRYRPTKLGLSIELENARVEITAVDDYDQRYKRLRQQGGMTLTAWCDIWIDKAPMAAIKSVEIANALMHPLSLATGNLVSWHSYDMLSPEGVPVATVHRGNNIGGRYSGLVVMMMWDEDMAACVRAWFDREHHLIFDLPDLSRLIRHHIDSCVEGPFIETRGLTAATPIDVLASKYASSVGKSDIIDQWQSERAALGDLHRRMQRGVHLPECPPHLFRGFPIRLRANGLDRECRQVVPVATGMPEHAVGSCAATDRLEHLVRERVIRRGKAHRVGGHERQLHPLRNGDQTAIDEFLSRVAVKRELQIQPTRIELYQPPRQAKRLDGSAGFAACSMAADRIPPPPGMPVKAITPSL
jgi:hypothetical protein